MQRMMIQLGFLLSNFRANARASQVERVDAQAPRHTHYPAALPPFPTACGVPTGAGGGG